MKSLKIVIFTFLFIGVFFTFLETIAAPMPPMPECMIRAEVVETDVMYSNQTGWSGFTTEEVVVEETPGWTVIQILQTEGEPVVDYEFASEDYCTEQYYTGREITLKVKEDYKKGTVIEGVLSTGGDEFGVWYDLKDTTVISTPEIEDSKEMSIFIYIAITLIVIALLYFIYKNKK